MSNTPRIEGTPDPRQTSSTKKESSIDPEKFKKILKVDESEETEKRRKRNLTKSEEDSDDEIDEIENSTTPETLFSTLMGDSKPTTSIFDAQDGTKQPLGSSSDAPTTSYADPFSNTTAAAEAPPAPPPLPQPIQEPSISEPGVEGEISASSPQTESSSSQDHSEKKREIDKEKIKQNFKKQKLEAEDAKPTAKMPLPPRLDEKTKAPLATPKKAPLADLEKKEERDTAPLKSKEKEIEKPREDVTVPLEPKKESSSLTNESIVDELSLTKKTRTSQLISHEKEEEKRDKDAKHAEESQIGSTGQQDTSPHLAQPIAPPEVLPTYAHFDKQVFDLFERMVGLITVEQSKGVSTTTVKISLPGTVYHGCEIKLDHYDTAPHSFNIQLIGSPEAVKSFAANFDDLAAAFRGGKFAFTVNLLQPELSPKHRHLIKRKSGPDEKTSQDGDQSPQ